MGQLFRKKGQVVEAKAHVFRGPSKWIGDLKKWENISWRREIQGKKVDLTKFKERLLTMWTLDKFLTCEEEKAKDHDRCVAKVEECRGAPHYVQLREKN